MDATSTVLIIDDDPRSRGDLKGMVQALGFDVITARNAKDGLSQCEECPPLAVITHLGLPQLSGLQAAYHLKARCSRTKVLLIIQDESMPLGHRLKDLGVDLLITAPVRFSALRRALWPRDEAPSSAAA